VVTGSIALFLYVFNDFVLGILLPHASPSIPLARHINTTVLWGFIFFSITFSLSGVVRSTGAVWAPLAILIVSMIGVRIPFAALLTPRLGEDAIWWSFPLGTITSAVLTSLYYKFGGWRSAHMLEEAPRGLAPDAGLAAPAMVRPKVDDAEAAGHAEVAAM
jgi:Na+-driven multidrug efflux pump